MRYRYRRVRPVVLLAIVGYLIVMSLVGWYFCHKGQEKALSANTAATAESGPTDFYSCFVDYAHAFSPGLPQKCTWKSKTYTRPAEFTDSDVRNLDKVPLSATAFVRDLAKKNFDACKAVPDTISVTRVLGVARGAYIHLVTGCDSGHAEILVKQDSKWASVVQTQNRLTCEDVDTYKIPKALFARGSSGQGSTQDSSQHTKCVRTSTGQTETIPY